MIPVPAADGLMTTAHSLAVARWGADPCGGQVAMSWTHMGGGINARSQWMSIDVHDPSTYSECSITYNLDVDWDWPKLCTVVEHELGHLSGHDHVDDPHDVMSPYYVFPSPECAPAEQAAVAPDRAPRSAASSKRASSAKKASAKRKSTKRRASAAAKRKPAKKRNSRRKSRTHSASLDSWNGLAGLRAPFFACALPR